MKNLLHLMITLFAAMLSFQSFAQVNISYPTRADSITLGLDTTFLYLRLDFTSGCSNGMTIGFPTGIDYVPGQLVVDPSSTASITEGNISNLNRPSFVLSNVVNNSFVIVKIPRIAKCTSLTSGKDTVTIFGGTGCNTIRENVGNNNNYNIKSPILTLNPPATLNNQAIHTNINRNFSIINGGNGALDTLRLYIVYSNGNVVNTNNNKLSVNGIDFSSFQANGDTLFYKIYGATIFNGDRLLSNGESILISEPVKVVKCGTNSTSQTIYGATFGHTHATRNCQSSTAIGTINLANGVPAITMKTRVIQGMNNCQKGIYELVYKNTGTGGVNGGLYNISVIVGSGDYAAYYINNFNRIDSVKISNQSNPNLLFTLSTPNSNGEQEMNISLRQLVSPYGSGLTAKDTAGFFNDLMPGDSFVLYVYRSFMNTNICPITNTTGGVHTKLRYNTACNPTSEIKTDLLYANIDVDFNGLRINDFNAIGPSMVTANNIFTISYCASFNYYNSFENSALTHNKSYIEIKLPPGVTYVSATSNSNNVVVSQRNDTLIIRSDGLSSNCMNVNFRYDCSSGNTLNFPSRMYYISDSTCNGRMYIGCLTKTIAAYCPGSGCGTGLVNKVPLAIRTTMGWTNSTMNTKVNPANLTERSLSTMLPLDSFDYIQSAVQNGSFNNAYFQFEMDKFDTMSLVKFASAKLFVKRNGVNIINGCSITSPLLDSSTNTTQKYFLNLTNCLPAGGLENNDSVWIVQKMTVTTANNGLLMGSTLNSVNGTSKFYNLSSGNSKSYCFDLKPNMFINGIYTDIAEGTVNLTCTPKGGNLGFGLRHNNSFDIFPNEFRPVFRVDSVKITNGTGISINTAFTPKITNSYYTSEFSSVGGPYQNIGVYLNTSTSNQAIFRFPNYELSDFTNRQDAIKYEILQACNAQSSFRPMKTVYYSKYFYSGLIVKDSSKNDAYFAVQPNLPNLTMNNSGVIQGINKSHHWNVTINNTSTSDAPYTWLAFEKGSNSGIIIDSVLDGAVKLTNVSNYGLNNANIYYKLATSGIVASGNKTYSVYFHYTNCSADSIFAKAGWNCNNYPLDPSTYPCPGASNYLKIVPELSQLQLTMTRHPGSGSRITLCSRDSIKFDYNSAAGANVVDPSVIIYPPNGVTLEQQVKVEYPKNSNIFYNVTTTASNGGYIVNLNSIPRINSNGIDGTLTSAGIDNRNANFTVYYTTTCDITSGSTFSIAGFGNRPCGASALGDGKFIRTNGVFIDGVNISGTLNIAMSLSANTATCSSGLTLNNTVTPTSGIASSLTDTIIYTLPRGLRYNGGFTGGNNCINCNVTTSINNLGLTTIKVALNNIVPAGQNVNFSFNVIANGEGCGTEKIIAEGKRSGNSLTCNTMVCPPMSEIIGKSESADLILSKPNLQIVNMSVPVSVWQRGTTQQVTVQIQNTSNVAYSANTDSIEFFCSTSSVPFQANPITVNIPANGTVTQIFDVTIPRYQTCLDNDVISSKIRTVLASGREQCLCAPSSFTMFNVPLPITLSKFTATQNNCSVNLEWDYNRIENHPFNFTVERSNNGAQFEALEVLDENAKHYTDNTVSNGNWMYRLQITDLLTNEVKYSNIINTTVKECRNTLLQVYPNPATDVLFVKLMGSGDEVQYLVTDMLDRTIQTGKLTTGNENVVSIKSLASGTYFIKVVSKSGTELVKFVKN